MDNDPHTQKQSLGRRQFLKIVAASGAALTAGLSFWQGREFILPDRVPVVHETLLLMNTVVNLTLVGEQAPKARQACQACVQEMQRQVNVFNRFDPNSDLSQLNANGKLKKPAPGLVALLHQAEQISQASAGAFDVSIKPLLDLYLAAQAAGSGQPEYEAISSKLKLVDHSRIHYDLDEVWFSTPGMNLTLDGIAKGAVVDAGVGSLKEWGFVNVIVEAAGDLLAAGEKALQSPWRIGIRQPRPQMSSLPVLNIRNAAVASSGDYMQAFSPDYSSHHILDPRRGFSPADLCSATVIAPTASLADGLATAVMVLGRQEGLKVVSKFPQCEAYLIGKDLESCWSPGMQLLSSDIL